MIGAGPLASLDAEFVTVDAKRLYRSVAWVTTHDRFNHTNALIIALPPQTVMAMGDTLPCGHANEGNVPSQLDPHWIPNVRKHPRFVQKLYSNEFRTDASRWKFHDVSHSKKVQGYFDWMREDLNQSEATDFLHSTASVAERALQEEVMAYETEVWHPPTGQINGSHDAATTFGKALGQEIFLAKPTDSRRVGIDASGNTTALGARRSGNYPGMLTHHAGADTVRSVLFPRFDMFATALCAIWSVALENQIIFHTYSMMDLTAFRNTAHTARCWLDFGKYSGEEAYLSVSDVADYKLRRVLSPNTNQPKLADACERVALWDSNVERFLANVEQRRHDPLWDAHACLQLAASQSTTYWPHRVWKKKPRRKFTQGSSSSSSSSDQTAKSKVGEEEEALGEFGL